MLFDLMWEKHFASGNGGDPSPFSMTLSKMKILTQTDDQIERKSVATNENCILRKISLKFKNHSFNVLWKIAFWNKQKWLNRELIIWSEFSGKIAACLMGQPSQQTFVGLQDVLQTSSRHVLKTSSIRLQRHNFTSSKTS